MTRPIANISLDLDNLWSYLKTHGDDAWASHPTYLDRVIDAILPVLERVGVRITFFVVGRDAADPRNGEPLRRLVAAGHTIGNHSFEHEPWMQRWDADAVHAELAHAEEALASVFDHRPRVFRGPGYACSDTMLSVLAERGYAADCSRLPTWLGPVGRWYYFRTARLSAAQRAERSELFGRWGDAARPLRPHNVETPAGSLLELPVTTTPLMRTPFHPSYILYAAGYSGYLADRYWDLALGLCRVRRVPPSILLHPLDFVGGDEVPELGFFPAMRASGAEKRRRVERCLRRAAERFDCMPTTDFPEQLPA